MVSTNIQSQSTRAKEVWQILVGLMTSACSILALARHVCRCIQRCAAGPGCSPVFCKISTAACMGWPFRNICSNMSFKTFQLSSVDNRRSAVASFDWDQAKRKRHHSKAVVVALLPHGIQQLFSLTLINVTPRKVGTFDLVNADEDLLLVVLREVKRLHGDIFVKCSRPGSIGTLNVCIIRVI